MRAVRDRIHVLMMIDELFDGIGGAERFAAALAGALPKDEFEATVCTTRTMTPGKLLDETRAAGVNLIEIGRTGRFDVLSLRKLGAYLRSQEVDVLHAHKFGSNLWGALVGRAARVPVVLAHEHTWEYDNKLRMLLDGRVIAPLVDRFLAVSELDRSRMIELEGVRPEKTGYMPVGYMPRPPQPRGDLRAELGLEDDVPIVGTLAALRTQKRLDDLIGAFATVLERVPDAHLVIGGDGEDKPRLEAAAAELPDGRVHFLGMREDLETILAAFDVAAMSSSYEGMPLFMAEALTHGTPFVCTRVGGVPDVVRDGVDGLLVEVGERDALADSIVRLLTDRDLAQTLAASGRERVRAFTLEQTAANAAALYRELLRR